MLDAALKSVARGALRRIVPQALVWRHLHRYGDDEIETQLLDLFAPANRDAIDVGANWGVYARKLANVCPRVHCFEPNPELAAILRRTLPRNCRVEQAAVSERDGSDTLHLPLDGARIIDGLASLRAPQAGPAAQIAVRTIALDAYADRPIGFVKIDVEGAEMSVLAGARALIARQTPTFLIEIEERHHAGAIDEARRFFEAIGYQGWFARADGLHPIELFDANGMQDWSLFNAAAPRRSQAYINNFLFAPTGRVTDEYRWNVEVRLAHLSADAA